MNFKKALFIYNPKSGNRKIPLVLDEIIEKLMDKHISIIPVRLDEHIYCNIEDILSSYEYDYVYAAGGDGTIMFVASKLIKLGIDKPLGVIGAGTCNNFAANIGMPSGISESIDVISQGHTQYVDYGELGDGRLFLSSVAAGVFAQISFETDQNIKEHLGPFAYYLRGITQLPNIRPYEFTVKTQDETVKENAYLVMVLTGSNIGSIRGMMNDRSDIQDGLFEVMIVKETNPMDLGDMLVKVVRGEDISESKSIKVLKGSRIEIDCNNKQIGVSVDGEKGPDLPFKIKVQKKAINVIVGENLV